MLDFLKNNPLVEGARNARFRPRTLLIHLLLFYLVQLIARAVTALPNTVYLSIRSFFLLLNEDESLLSDPTRSEELMARVNELLTAVSGEVGYILTALFSTVFIIAIVIVFCRFIERRTIASMGLHFDLRALGQYGLGLAVGLVLALATFLVLYSTRAVEVSVAEFSPLFIILYLFGFLIQGAAEEVLLRGYFMVSATNVASPLTAVFFSALIFSMLHVGNVGVSVLGMLNIFLFGVLLGFIVFRTRSLWLAMALHGIFNFAEGNILGFPVSGIVTGQSFLTTVAVDGRTLTHGGTFGPEGGAALSMVLLLAIAIFLILPQKRVEQTVGE